MHSSVKLIPSNPDDLLFVFPYNDIGRRFNRSSQDLFIFGNRLFNSSDDYEFLCPDVGKESPYEIKTKNYKKVMITKKLYRWLKANVGTYETWLSTDHMGFTHQWFLQNKSSHLSDSFEVIQSDFLQTVCNFYVVMMGTGGPMSTAQNAWSIHRFLLKNVLLLFKRFVFFDQNEGNQHWINTCLCNPWFILLKDWKENNVTGIPSALDQLQDNDFVHGWVMFDPLHGFINKTNSWDKSYYCGF